MIINILIRSKQNTSLLFSIIPTTYTELNECLGFYVILNIYPEKLKDILYIKSIKSWIKTQTNIDQEYNNGVNMKGHKSGV